MNQIVSTQHPGVQAAAANLIFEPQESINSRVINAEHEARSARRGRFWARFFLFILLAMLATAIGSFGMFYTWSSEQISQAHASTEEQREITEEIRTQLVDEQTTIAALRKALNARRRYERISDFDTDIRIQELKLIDYKRQLEGGSTLPRDVREALNLRSNAGDLRRNYENGLETEVTAFTNAVEKVETHIRTSGVSVVRPQIPCDPWDPGATC